MNLLVSVKKGTLSGFKVVWELAKVLVPAIMVIQVLEKTGYLAYLSTWLSPVMSIFGVPGEGALVLVTANFVSFYAGVATLVALNLPVKQMTILAAMMLIFHAVVSETALVAKAGARASWVLAARLLAAIVTGVLLNLFLP